MAAAKIICLLKFETGLERVTISETDPLRVDDNRREPETARLSLNKDYASLRFTILL